jgi:outer membrane usher protein
MRHSRWKTSDRATAFFLFFSLFLLSASVVSSQDLGEFEFEPQSIYLPLLVDSRPVGEIETLPMEELDTQVNADELYDLLSGRVDEQKLEGLREFPDDWISMEQLQEYPFDVTFNMFDLTVEVIIPPESTVSRVISLASTSDPIEYTRIDPADFSFYTNIYSSFTFGNYEDVNQNIVTFEPSAQINLNPTFNILGWVVNSRITVSTTADKTISIGRIDLSKDWPELPLRLMAGDIVYNTASNQSSPSYFGAVLSKERSRSFEKKQVSDFTYEFLVPEDNLLVRVLMNGRNIKRERLNANRYTLEDFYFSSGLNQFDIIIEDDDQVITSEQFLFAYDSRITPVGQDQFTAGFGFKNRDLQQIPELFGMHQFGISDHSSAEYFLQAGDKQQNLGASLVYATNLGNFKLSGAGTLIGYESLGYYASLSYTYLRPISAVNRTFSLAGSFQSSGYASFSNTDQSPTNPPAPVRLTSGYSQTLFGILGFSSSANMQINRSMGIEDVLFSVNLSTRLSSAVSMSARFRGEWDDDGFDPTLTVTANISPVNSNLSSAVRQDFFESAGGASISARYSPESISNAASFSLNASGITSEDPIPDSMSFGGSFSHRDYTFSAEQRISRSRQTSYVTALNFNTAVSYADGLFGISRPISDAFVLVAPRQQLDGYVMGVNPTGSGHVARTDEFGAAVVHNLSSFSRHSIVIDPIEMPDGFEVGTDRYTYSPLPQQGAVLKLGVESNVTVTGVMEFSDGTPAALYPGEYIKIGAPEEEINYFFTNTDGTYELYGLGSGEYRVTLYIGEGITFRLQVPEGKSGIIQAKKIILPARIKVF